MTKQPPAISGYEERISHSGHRLTPQRLQWVHGKSLAMSPQTDRLTRRGSLRVEEGELPALGLPPPRQFAVPANTLVVADTHGFHARGASTRPAEEE